MEIVDNIKKFPATGDIFKVPYKQDYLICCASDKRKAYSRTDLSFSDIFKGFSQGYRGFYLDSHLLFFSYNNTIKYDNTIVGKNANVYIENSTIIYHASEGDECIENNTKTTYQFYAKLDCDSTLPKKNLQCPAFWKKGNCTVETVLKSSEACQHPIFNSKGTYNIKCINRITFEKEMHRLED